MMDLRHVTMAFGLVVTVIFGLLVWAPERAGRWWLRFPRSVWAGRVLALMAIACLVPPLFQAHFHWIDERPWLVWFMAPAAYALIVVFMDDLLAARALGGLFLIVPLPILDAAFMHPSASRLIMTSLAYGLALLGMVWTWSPYQVRRMTAGWMADARRCRAAGMTGMAAGVGRVLLGWLVY